MSGCTSGWPWWVPPLIAVGFWVVYLTLLNIFFSWRERLAARAKWQRLIDERAANTEDAA